MPAPALLPEPRPAPPALDQLSFEAAITELRDDVFALVELTLAPAPGDLTDLHVCLQSVANELGRAERLLRARR